MRLEWGLNQVIFKQFEWCEIMFSDGRKSNLDVTDGNAY